MTDSFLHKQSLGFALRFREAQETYRAAGRAVGEAFQRTLDELLDIPTPDSDS